MAQMISLTRKCYDEQGSLVDVSVLINADNINTIEDAKFFESWERSIITMENGDHIQVAEVKDIVENLING